MNTAAAGFVRAPLSFGVIVLTSVASIVASQLTSNKRASFALNLSPLVTEKLQLWRFLSTHVIFATTGEFICGLILLYQFRIFERQLGSKKFAAALLFYLSTSTAFQLLLLLMFPTLRYAIIFGLFVHYGVDIPASSRITLLGLHFSNKWLVYLVGLQIMFASYPASAWTAACGLLGGVLYRAFFHRLLRMPAFIARLFDAASASSVSAAASDLGHAYAPLQGDVGFAEAESPRASQSASFPASSSSTSASTSASSAPASASASASASAARSDQLLPGDLSAQFAQALMGGLPPPDPVAVQQLVDMGFGPQEVRTTLAMTGNNVDMAANLLFESRSRYL